jgi:hypothetical protein
VTQSLGIGRGGARPGAGRRKGGHNRVPSKRRSTFEKAAKGGLMPLEFLLAEMRDLTVPREERRLIAKWAAPYLYPRLSAVAVMKSVWTMTEEELAWAIKDAEEGPSEPTRFRPRVIDGGR